MTNGDAIRSIALQDATKTKASWNCDSFSRVTSHSQLTANLLQCHTSVYIHIGSFHPPRAVRGVQIMSRSVCFSLNSVQRVVQYLEPSLSHAFAVWCYSGSHLFSGIGYVLYVCFDRVLRVDRVYIWRLGLPTKNQPVVADVNKS